MRVHTLETQTAADPTRTIADLPSDCLSDLTWKIIGAAHKVNRVLGGGFLEKVYENALLLELRRASLDVQQQHPLEVRYEGEIVGAYVTDLFVESLVLVELKAQTLLQHAHHSQCLNYLRATNLRLCLLMNFGRPRLEVRRIVNHL
jgi:GxxExxY protein